MSTEENIFTEDDRKALEEFKQEKAKKEAEKAKLKKRDERLGSFLNHPENSKYYKEIYDKHLKEDVESDPGLLDSDSSVKYLFKKGKDAYMKQIELEKQEKEKDEKPKSGSPQDTKSSFDNDAPPPDYSDPDIKKKMDTSKYFDPEVQDKLNLSTEAKMMLNVHKRR